MLTYANRLDPRWEERFRLPKIPGISRRRFLQASAAVSAGSVLRAQKSSAAVYTRTPNIQNVSANAASIVWALTTQVAGAISIAEPSGSTVTLPATVTEFDPAATGLAATYYQYAVSIGGLK